MPTSISDEYPLNPYVGGGGCSAVRTSSRVPNHVMFG